MRRRTFLGAMAGAAGMAGWGRVARCAPSANGGLNFLAIGVRNRGGAISVGSRAFGRVVACCDVDTSCVEKFFGHLDKVQPERPRVYRDYREALGRDDIDAVTIGTPDHWHAKMIVDAVRAGKDVYVEKPMTLTVGGGEAVCRAVKESGRVVQVGTQQRSEYDGIFLKAVALARMGKFGPRLTATVKLPPRYGKGNEVFPFVAVPEGLDWDGWLGPSPKSRYCPQRCHGSWRMWLETGCGPLTDWGVHHVDIAIWAIDPPADGVVEIEGSGTFPHGREASRDVLLGRRPFDSLPNGFSTVMDYGAVLRFPGGHELRIDGRARESGQGKPPNGLELSGAGGSVWVSREGKEHAIRGSALDAAEGDARGRDAVRDAMMRLYKGKVPRWAQAEKVSGDIVPTAHMDNFVSCVRDRGEPVADVWSHHRSNTLCLLAHIAMLAGRPIRWDLGKRAILGDEEGAALLRRTAREGYDLL
ncbi:MAG: Gfo/Idh/MocA family oxidoreductase [Verrucomicrobiae bacterium]|nr:Gfo/Idh/MocA family oxidoreductase [Verrucomicrobiae bacterium]